MSKKKIIAGLFMVMLIMGNALNVYANAASFEKAYVEGNQYNLVLGLDKDSSNKYVKIFVNTIYTTDNKVSDVMKKTKAQIRGWNGKEYVRCVSATDYGKTIVKREIASFELLKEYQKKGKTIKYWAKGNNPDKDCKISGTMWVD